MKIDAKVQSISKLKDYFFLVPDYQREYVWKPDDEVEQFLIDIENEYSPDAKEQRNYFLGSIIIVNNDRCFDVVDGQQRLTTIMLSLCVFRDLYNRGIQMYRFPNSDVQKSVIFEGIKKRLKIV